MTKAATIFAREWLNLMGSILFAAAVTFLYQASYAPAALSEMLLVTAIFSIVAGVPLYLALGIIRITLWALYESQPDTE